MPNTIFILAIALVIVLLVLRLLRNRALREKYAALWIIVGTATVVLVAFPDLLTFASRLLGFNVGSNLLFALSIVLLLGVTLHLSLEISRLEDETRVLAEESAIQRVTIGRLARRVDALEAASAADDDRRDDPGTRGRGPRPDGAAPAYDPRLEAAPARDRDLPG